MSKKLYSQFKYQNRVICWTEDKKIYYDIVKDANKFRASLDEFIKQFPQLFPAEITKGYQLKEIREPKKLPVPIRRLLIKETNISYTIRPSFVMPYLTAMTEDVERVLFLRKYNVPFHALSYVFGKNAMKWNRRKSFCTQKLFRRLEFLKILVEIVLSAPQSNIRPIYRNMSLLMKNILGLEVKKPI